MLRLFLYTAVGPILAVKVWQPCTDIGDATNWPNNRFPQACDTLDLSPAGGISMRLSGLEGGQFSGLILPRDSVLDLPETTSVSFAANKQCSRESKVSEFRRGSVKSWLDPSSWNYTVPPTQWLPHVERIPCAGETIVFPPDRGFTISLPTVMVPTGLIVFANKEYDAMDWSTFLKSEEGFENFQGSPEMRELPWREFAGCASTKNCYCTRGAYAIRDWTYMKMEARDIEEAVCKYEGPRCLAKGEMPCRSPIKPTGHCCYICGAILEVADGTVDGLLVPVLQNTVEAMVRDTTSGYRYYVGRKSDGDIQVVVLANSGDSTAAYDFAQQISQRLYKGVLGSKMIIAVRHSGLEQSKNPVQVTLSVLSGTLLFVLAMFGTVYYLNVVFPAHRWMTQRRGQMFARFQNTPDEYGGVVVNTVPSDAFHNPLYQSGTSFATAKISSTAIGETSAGVELPTLPTEQQPTTISDPANTTSVLFTLKDSQSTIQLAHAGNVSQHGSTTVSDPDDTSSVLFTLEDPQSTVHAGGLPADSVDDSDTDDNVTEPGDGDSLVLDPIPIERQPLLD